MYGSGVLYYYYIYTNIKLFSNDMYEPCKSHNLPPWPKFEPQNSKFPIPIHVCCITLTHSLSLSHNHFKVFFLSLTVLIWVRQVLCKVIYKYGNYFFSFPNFGHFTNISFSIPSVSSLLLFLFFFYSLSRIYPLSKWVIILFWTKYSFGIMKIWDIDKLIIKNWKLKIYFLNI